MTTDTLWRNTESLPPLFAAAATGDPKASRELLRALDAADSPTLEDWPRAVRSCWREGLTILAEGIDRHALGEEQKSLVLAAAATGFDHILLRDTVATMARKSFASYADPAGMIAALGVYDLDTPLPLVRRRWDVFAALGEDVVCCDPGRGAVGTVAEIDAIVDEATVVLDHPFAVSVSVIVANYILVKPGSDLDLLFRGDVLWDNRLSPDGFATMLEESLAYAGETPANLGELLLVPRILTAEQFRAWQGRRTDDDAREEVGERPWDEARGIDELVGLMARQQPKPERPAGFDSIRSILLAAAPRDDQAPTFAEAVARLVAVAHGQNWADELIASVAADAVVWRDRDRFVTICDHLSGRLLPAWYRGTLAACSAEFLAEICPSMPLRIWNHAERLLAETPGAESLLVQSVLHTVAAGNTSCDALLWLWRTGGEPAGHLANATLLFRTLAKPVRGSYLKANRDLRKLLQENESFQRLLMKNGDPESIASLVRCVKHLPLLDAGERQSLLVRIVRIFPEAMSIVEERKAVVAQRELDRLTSVRTFEQRRRELEEIINVKIPANSRAIGHARQLGDLRENAEFKAAKDEQAFLSARRAELERDLHEIKATTFDHIVVGSVVQPGCAVEIALPDGETRTYYLLGLWDSVPERRILSYDTPLGRALVGTSVGDEVTMPSGSDAVVSAVRELPDEIKQWVRTPPAE